MGLSNYFSSSAEWVLPVLVMNTIFSMALLKNMARSVLQIVGAFPNLDEDDPSNMEAHPRTSGRARRVSITRFKSLCKNRDCLCNNGVGTGTSIRWFSMECCVCLCGFESDEEVSELSCKHFFHKDCLEKWFDNYQHTTCPLCRSIF
ncbi:E3 ubiquitin-protein ligase XERICO [Actinidia chinensis var. chinensis]|uniref:E3 ubiquitin-protein ligase XERICO n=1 Tax=Actinidia chinensis var. chinensis TaxID=1590841 RepID=A0A2R6REC1_ACTCC|nr:E3 ubiquitin-protein ligase XERICO [Actinidia chinensis var. chinensis]